LDHPFIIRPINIRRSVRGIHNIAVYGDKLSTRRRLSGGTAEMGDN
jgi:hypothetical protein